MKSQLLTIVLVLPTVNFQPMRALAQTKSSQSNRAAEILWDTWGAPHIFAKDTNSAGRALGWAQMQNHGNRLLRVRSLFCD